MLALCGDTLADVVGARIAIIAVTPACAPATARVHVAADRRENAASLGRASIDRAGIAIIADRRDTWLAEARDTALAAVAGITIVAVAIIGAAITDRRMHATNLGFAIVGRASITIVAGTWTAAAEAVETAIGFGTRVAIVAGRALGQGAQPAFAAVDVAVAEVARIPTGAVDIRPTALGDRPYETATVGVAEVFGATRTIVAVDGRPGTTRGRAAVVIRAQVAVVARQSVGHGHCGFATTKVGVALVACARISIITVEIDLAAGRAAGVEFATTV